MSKFNAVNLSHAAKQVCRNRGHVWVIKEHVWVNLITLPVRMEWSFLEAVSHIPAPDWPSLATHVCCRIFAQACTHAQPSISNKACTVDRFCAY